MSKYRVMGWPVNTNCPAVVEAYDEAEAIARAMEKWGPEVLGGSECVRLNGAEAELFKIWVVEV